MKSKCSRRVFVGASLRLPHRCLGQCPHQDAALFADPVLAHGQGLGAADLCSASRRKDSATSGRSDPGSAEAGSVRLTACRGSFRLPVVVH